MVRRFCIWKGARILKKIYHNRSKKITFLRADRKNTVFEISRNLIRKSRFQITLKARKSCANSFLKIKTDDNQARFSRNQQNRNQNQNFEKSKIRQRNRETLACKSIRETSRFFGVHQRAADYLHRS